LLLLSSASAHKPELVEKLESHRVVESPPGNRTGFGYISPTELNGG